MKHSILLIAMAIFILLNVSATDHTIVTIGNTYSPSSITVQLGYRVTINAIVNHPTTQVSLTTWNANGSTPVGGGFVQETS